MIEAKREGREVELSISGKQIEVLEARADYIAADCDWDDLVNEHTHPLPTGLRLETYKEDGFGTLIFPELLTSPHPEAASAGLTLRELLIRRMKTDSTEKRFITAWDNFVSAQQALLEKAADVQRKTDRILSQ